MKCLTKISLEMANPRRLGDAKLRGLSESARPPKENPPPRENNNGGNKGNNDSGKRGGKP